MAERCCSGEPEAAEGTEVKCPECGAAGKPISTVTLKHMVNPEFLKAVNETDFQFCRSADCDVVYFHADGVRLHKADVRVRVGLKENEDPVLICYCFGFTEAMARLEIESTGECTIPEQILAEMKQGRCACEIRNPQGSCCLGIVRVAVKKMQEAAAARR